MGFPAIFEQGPKPKARTAVTGAAIYTFHVGADFQFEVFCRIIYKLGELDGETERIVVVAQPFFAEKGTSV